MSDSHAPRLAWFTPLRPVESGISQYNEELLPVLARVWRLDVYVDGYRPTHLSPGPSLRIRHAREFPATHRRQPYDAVVYQMGNSPAHAYMYRTALEVPGIVVLHDTLLHHLILSMLLRGRGARRYRALMERRYGSQGVAVAERVLRGQTPPALFDYPLSEDLIEAARTVVVHSDASQRQVLGWCPSARVFRVPMGIRLPPSLSRATARRLLSLPDDQFVVASVTHVNPYKRLDVVLRALRRLRQSQAARLVVAGSVSPQVPLARMVALLGLEQAVDLLGFVDDRTARLTVAAADVCVNLRYPTAGETSASLLRTMGAGRAVLVTDAGSFQEIPDDAVVKIPADALEEDLVFEMLRELWARPSLRDAIGDNARRFVEREHGLGAMAAGYHAAIEAAIGALLPAPPAGNVQEEVLDVADAVPPPTDPVTESIAAALTELGLGGDESLLRAAAAAASELGLAPGKMKE